MTTLTKMKFRSMVGDRVGDASTEIEIDASVHSIEKLLVDKLGWCYQLEDIWEPFRMEEDLPEGWEKCLAVMASTGSADSRIILGVVDREVPNFVSKNAHPSMLWAEIYRLRSSVFCSDGIAWQDHAAMQKVRAQRFKQIILELDPKHDLTAIDGPAPPSAIDVRLASIVAHVTDNPVSNDVRKHIDMYLLQAAQTFGADPEFIFDDIIDGKIKAQQLGFNVIDGICIFLGIPTK